MSNPLLEQISNQMKSFGDLPLEQISNMMLPQEDDEATINSEFIDKRHKF